MMINKPLFLHKTTHRLLLIDSILQKGQYLICFMGKSRNEVDFENSYVLELYFMSSFIIIMPSILLCMVGIWSIIKLIYGTTFKGWSAVKGWEKAGGVLFPKILSMCAKK